MHNYINLHHDSGVTLFFLHTKFIKFTVVYDICQRHSHFRYIHFDRLKQLQLSDLSSCTHECFIAESNTGKFGYCTSNLCDHFIRTAYGGATYGNGILWWHASFHVVGIPFGPL